MGETALRQYEREIQELRDIESAVGSEHFAPVRPTYALGSCVLLAGVAVVAATLLHADAFANTGPLGFVLVLLGGYVLLLSYRNADHDSAELTDLRERIGELERLIEQEKLSTPDAYQRPIERNHHQQQN
jgi:hypothetical protein